MSEQDGQQALEAAQAFEAEIEQLEALAKETADHPVPELTREQVRALIEEHAGRPVEFARRFGMPLMASLSLRDRAWLCGRSVKHEWLISQVAEVPEDVFDELLEALLDELPEHQRTTQAIFTRIVDIWRQQTGARPIRDPDAPTHRCPSCGYRW